jgi:hypothetical protein
MRHLDDKKNDSHDPEEPINAIQSSEETRIARTANTKGFHVWQIICALTLDHNPLGRRRYLRESPSSLGPLRPLAGRRFEARSSDVPSFGRAWCAPSAERSVPMCGRTGRSRRSTAFPQPRGAGLVTLGRASSDALPFSATFMSATSRRGQPCACAGRERFVLSEWRCPTARPWNRHHRRDPFAALSATCSTP